MWCKRGGSLWGPGLNYSTHHGTQAPSVETCAITQRCSDTERTSISSFRRFCRPSPQGCENMNYTIAQFANIIFRFYSLGIAALLLAVRFLIKRTGKIEVHTMLSKSRNSFFLLNLIASYRILQRKLRSSHLKRAEAFPKSFRISPQTNRNIPGPGLFIPLAIWIVE